ncbi:aldo/keto reductase [Endozoicomonas elysicola]|uniref:Aldo/keto reductase n=1 Tax=Endozoicomonas elysicola TaxID=305900 RepID=A0A081KG22_9GAMM|nr:aldo/keto reductase [Endozoicomonas elysicola]KEI73098.1 aldo/keto reductase [Endozoicomonas elysicola]
MNRIPLTIFLPEASRIAAGCMGLGGNWDNSPLSQDHILQAHQFVDSALESGLNFFDHADIYTRGKAEQVFGQVLADRPGLRESIFLQSKCGIRFAEGQIPNRYDFSREWILFSIENSLARLKTDYLDLLLLHRPDPLMQPEEIAEAFHQLQKSGKVRHFGVSNMSGHQIKYLQSFLEQPIVVNQLQMSLTHLDWLDEGVLVNHPEGQSVGFTPGTVEYCRSHNIQLQAWGCLSKGVFTGKDVRDEPEFIQATARLVDQFARELGASREAVVLAWLMRHPAGIQPVIGTTNVQRIRACHQVENIELSREQWYQLYVSARGRMLP